MSMSTHTGDRSIACDAQRRSASRPYYQNVRAAAVVTLGSEPTSDAPQQIYDMMGRQRLVVVVGGHGG